MANSQIYGQVAGYGVGVGYDANAGITFTFFTGASVGVAGSAAWTLSLDLFDVNEDFIIDTSAATYIGGGTPIGLPLQLTAQRNTETGDVMITAGAGISDVLEVGFSYESSNGEFRSDFSATRYDRTFSADGVVIVSEISGNYSGYTLVNSYVTDLSGNRLAPIEGAPYLQAGGYPLDPTYNSYYTYRNDESSSYLIESQCFTAGAAIDMWPTDPSIVPDISGVYDETAVRATSWKKQIEEVSPGDWVLSFDENGNLQPGRVSRAFSKDVQGILGSGPIDFRRVA